MDGGTLGGIVGGVFGVLGGAIGTYFSVRNTTKPRERSLMIWSAALCWLWLGVFTTLQLLTPRPWDLAVFPLMFTPFLTFRWLIRKLAHARAEDAAAQDRLPRGPNPTSELA